MAASENPPAPALTTKAQRELSQLGAFVQSEQQAADLWQQLTAKEQADLGDDFLQAYTEHGTVGMWRRLHDVSWNRAVIEIARELGLVRDSQFERLRRELSRVDQVVVVDDVLSRREQQVLVGLLQLEATDPNTRCTTREVVDLRYGLDADPVTFKDVVSKLSKMGLIGTKGGGGGGCWLTEIGKERAARISL